MSLTKKILLCVSCTITIILSLSLSIVYFQSKDLILNQGKERALSIIKTFEATMDQTNHMTQGNKKFNELIQSQLIELKTRLPEIIDITIYDIIESKRAVASTNLERVNREADPEDIEAAKQNKTVVIVDEEDGNTIVDVTLPLHLNGKIAYVAGIKVNENEAMEGLRGLLVKMAVVGIICLCAGILVIWYFYIKKMVKQVVHLMHETQEMAKGNFYDTQHEVLAKDEIGQLADALGKMKNNVRILMKQVTESEEQVAASAEELTSNINQTTRATNQVVSVITKVEHGAERQLKAVCDAASVVGQMSAGVQQIAASANAVADKSAQSAKISQDGSKAVEDAIRQMGHIEETVTRSAHVVTKLGDRSKEISQIVDTISGIAGQTNLLALNAAIEAARAGEQGRGFAVVADEVRKLAEQSQEAAKKIASLINQIQQDTDNAVVAMSQGTKEVHIGTEVVNLAGQTFQESFRSFNEVTIQIQEISTAIQQMSEESQQIVVLVRDIDIISKETLGQAQTISAATVEQSATMEEIAASNQELSKMAKKLAQAIGEFKV